MRSALLLVTLALFLTSCAKPPPAPKVSTSREVRARQVVQPGPNCSPEATPLLILVSKGAWVSAPPETLDLFIWKDEVTTDGWQIGEQHTFSTKVAYPDASGGLMSPPIMGSGVGVHYEPEKGRLTINSDYVSAKATLRISGEPAGSLSYTLEVATPRSLDPCAAEEEVWTINIELPE